MAQGVKTGGRRKGTPNKMTVAAKDAIAMAADALGGSDRIVAWAREAPENERAFWTSIFPKLIPAQIEHSGDIGGGSSKEQRDAAVSAAILAQEEERRVKLN